MAKICFSPSESRCLATAWPVPSKSVIAKVAGSMWIRSTRVCLRSRKRNDSVMRPESRSILRSVARVRNSCIVSRVRPASSHHPPAVLGGELFLQPVAPAQLVSHSCTLARSAFRRGDRHVQLLRLLVELRRVSGSLSSDGRQLADVRVVRGQRRWLAPDPRARWVTRSSRSSSSAASRRRSGEPLTAQVLEQGAGFRPRAPAAGLRGAAGGARTGGPRPGTSDPPHAGRGEPAPRGARASSGVVALGEQPQR